MGTKSNNMSKADIVRSLAIEMGKTDVFDTHYGEKRYDPQTGTLYCFGHIINKNQVEDAKDYFRSQIKAYQDKADIGVQRAAELVVFYQTALTGISYLQQAGDKVHDQIILQD